MVGDIIRLRRFNFVVSENGELVGHHQNYSNWLVYDGEDEENKIISHQDIEKNKHRQLTTEEQTKITNLRKWAKQFLSTNSVHQIAWWNGLREPIVPELAVKNKEKASEIDLVLRTEAVNRAQKKVRFKDIKGNVYHLILYAVPVLKEGDVIKLKCVDVFFTKDGRYVRLTPTTSCLSMPAFSLDAQVFLEETLKKQVLSIKTKSPFRIEEDEDNFYNTRKRLLDKFPFLENYNFEDKLINHKYFSLEDKPLDIVSEKVSMISKNYENRIPVDLDYLVDILSDPVANDIAELLHQRFVLNVNIANVINKKAPKFIKKHCSKCFSTAPINEGDFECCSVLMDLFFHLVFVIEQASQTGVKKQLPVYVVIGKNSHLFDLWELIPKPDDYLGFIKWNTVKEFNQKMESFANLERSFELLVELKTTVDNKPFLNLVETILMP